MLRALVCSIIALVCLVGLGASAKAGHCGVSAFTGGYGVSNYGYVAPTTQAIVLRDTAGCGYAAPVAPAAIVLQDVAPAYNYGYGFQNVVVRDFHVNRFLAVRVNDFRRDVRIVRRR